ncbi:MAG: YjbQ family protein [Gammaproteobacteria bacterium]|nr:MAG: YjbQ family protein [Gammaproteobacteria bacterium]
MIISTTISTHRQGLHEITRELQAIVQKEAESRDGLCTIFIQHTSASLLIQENADPAAQFDLEQWLNRMVPSNQPQFTHTAEGPDDMPSHIKAMLTETSLSIPVVDGRLALGTWQGIFLWEHRTRAHQRRLVIHLSF